MTLHEFIFSRKIPGRYFRHIAFWIAQYAFWLFWATGFFQENYFQYIKFQFNIHAWFILDMIYTYLVVYYFLPKYLVSKRYLEFGIWNFVLTIFTYALYICYRFWFHGLNKLSGDEQMLNIWYISVNFFINGPPVICTMFLAFKMFKNHYVKMEEKKVITIENASAELQLLKAQIHPHFLFNTLNNIYSFALNKSQQAGSLVQKLSDTLKYMINDCEAQMVPVEKEIKMIQDYIGLEKVRYGKRLSIEILIIGIYQDKFIAPLLLIPFVENCFKHGTSKMLEQPWIKLEITVNDNELVMNLSNSKPAEAVSMNVKKGIGLKIVHSRLSLIYPLNHQIKISADENSFSVFLKIPLQEAIQIDPAEISGIEKFHLSKTLSHV